jgi:hypothetical protein
MGMRLLWLAFLAALVAGAQPRGTPPDVELVDFRVVREKDQLLIDGVLVSHRQEPIRGLHIKVDLLDSDGKLLGERQTTLTESMIESGDEVPFHLATRGQARVISVRVDVFNARKSPLVLKGEPSYVIE